VITGFERVDGRILWQVGGVGAFMCSVVGSGIALDQLTPHASPAARALAIGALVVIAQLVFYWRLRRAFATNNMV
jgi:type VI protein secretion system component VasK